MKSTCLSPMHYDFCETGVDMNSFREVAQYMDAATKIVRTEPNNFSLGHCLSLDNKYLMYITCCQQKREIFSGISWDFHKVRLKLPSIGKKTFDALYQMVTEEKLLLQKMEPSIGVCDHLLVSGHAVQTISNQMAKDDQYLFGDTKTFERSVAMQLSFFKRDTTYSFVLRESGKLQAVMAILPKYHVRLKLNYIYEIIKGINGTISFWDVRQDISYIYFTLPNKEQYQGIQPGFLLRYSDIGYCPISLSLVWKLETETEDFYFQQHRCTIGDDKKLQKIADLSYKEREMTLYKNLIDAIKTSEPLFQSFYENWTKTCLLPVSEKIKSICFHEVQNDMGLRNFRRIEQTLQHEHDMKDFLISIMQAYTSSEVFLPDACAYSSDLLLRILTKIKKQK